MKYLFFFAIPLLICSCKCPCSLIKEKREQRILEKTLFKLSSKEKKFAFQLSSKNQDIFIHKFNRKERDRALNLSSTSDNKKVTTPNESVEFIYSLQN